MKHLIIIITYIFIITILGMILFFTHDHEDFVLDIATTSIGGFLGFMGGIATEKIRKKK